MAEQWAVFPTLDCMMRYITGLESLHLELDGKREIIMEDINQKIRQIERSGKTDEEFTLLTQKGFKFPGISEPSIHLPLPIDSEIVWVFETGRFQRVVESWTSPTGNPGLAIKVRHRFCLEYLRASKHTGIPRKRETSLKQLRGWKFWRTLRNTKVGNPRRLCDHSLYSASSRYLKAQIMVLRGTSLDVQHSETRNRVELPWKIRASI